MKEFMMKARTHNGDWYPFTISDLPVHFLNNEFVLINKQGSPKLCSDVILRGIEEYDLYEGDVIEADGDRWLICYERGFYGINNKMQSRYLYTFTDYQVIGSWETIDLGVVFSLRRRCLFKYKESIFRLDEIHGVYQGNLLLRAVNAPVPVSEVRQECCATYKGNRLYLGDVIEGRTVDLLGGRITLCGDTDVVDIVAGGIHSYGDYRRSNG